MIPICQEHRIDDDLAAFRIECLDHFGVGERLLDAYAD